MPEKEITSNEDTKCWVAIAIKLLQHVVPQANPDFDHLIGSVTKWMLEYDCLTDCVTREIGVINGSNTVVKLPNETNYGYWSDNIMCYKDFVERFSVEKISREEFEEKWK
ncbi:hypothetical protein [Neolewinella maritima]|uniref:hypothetical protein n=1 Tax=Neolewinella maritima TaxID=1383882 RepID=UPI001EE85E41|nr:hypothetical protein [Neolewinella maritima]